MQTVASTESDTVCETKSAPASNGKNFALMRDALYRLRARAFRPFRGEFPRSERGFRCYANAP